MKNILIALFLFIPVFVFCQSRRVCDTKYFDINLAGGKIGELIATRTTLDTITLYSIESNVDFWFIISIHVHHKTETIYHGKKLFSSISTSNTTKGDFNSSTIWKNGHYQVEVDSYKYRNSIPINEDVHFSIARLYFDEPVNTQKSLADGYGILASVNKVKSGNYEVECLGNKNRFFYDHGILIRANLYSKVKNYEVVLRK